MPKGSRILVADDDKILVDMYQERLGAAGYNVTICHNGEEALKEIHETKPELVLLDIMMPKLDGISVLWELKANPQLAAIPVVVLTNIGDVGTISKIVEAGAVDYLLKSDQSMDDVVQKGKDVLSRSVQLA